MSTPADRVRDYLHGVVVELLEIDPALVEVRISHDPGRRGTTFSIGVPDDVRGLILGPGGAHARAFESLARMRALRIGWRGSFAVRVPRDG